MNLLEIYPCPWVAITFTPTGPDWHLVRNASSSSALYLRDWQAGASPHSPSAPLLTVSPLVAAHGFIVASGLSPRFLKTAASAAAAASSISIH